MKQKIIARGALGFPLGITIGYLITIFISLAWADGYYTPCEPNLAYAMGSEINAVLLQALLSGILGIGFSSASVIWEIDHLGIVQQTGIYFAIVALIMMPIAYFLYWMEHTLWGFLSYFLIFILVFIVLWIVMFIIGKHTVRKMNANLHQVMRDENEQEKDC